MERLTRGRLSAMIPAELPARWDSTPSQSVLLQLDQVHIIMRVVGVTRFTAFQGQMREVITRLEHRVWEPLLHLRDDDLSVIVVTGDFRQSFGNDSLLWSCNPQMASENWD
jgi:hypothetical protein